MFLLKVLLVIVLFLGVISTPYMALARYVPTSRDTQFIHTPMEIHEFDFTDYEFIHEAGDLRFYFRSDRDIIAVFDLRNGYTWTTGLDVALDEEVDLICNDLDPQERAASCPPKENRLNATFTNMANSLITIEFFDASHSIQRLSSATQGVHSELRPLGGNGEFMFDVSFSRPNIQISVHIILDENGIHYTIENEHISGDDQHELAAILITPFLGASGGEERLFNPETNTHDILQRKERIPGYFFVPDGPGALIRFRENNTSLLPYVGVVYGENYSEAEFFERSETSFVPLQNPLIPVFGAAHGYNQNAFVAFATQGDEHMEIIVSPEENMTAYTWGYPRFVMNTLYYQIFNRRGQGYFTLLPERHQYDIQISYHFLQGDGTEAHAANYFGMAKAYQEVLLAQGHLTRKTNIAKQMPVRIDFLMSDMRNTVLGRQHVVMTTPSDISGMLTELTEAGITNINGGLLGFGQGGLTFAHPGRMNFRRAIGNRRAFADLIDTAALLNVDLSFSQDYVMFSPNGTTERNHAARHANGWYMRYHLLSMGLPERTFTFARPETSMEWLTSQLEAQRSLGITSITIDGISNTLLSDFSRNPMTRTEAKYFIMARMAEIDEEVMINAVAPNLYFLGQVDRFLQTPVFSSQHLIQTDTVPFLQILLFGMMELYAPYANFSFKDQADVLRMIDYNVMPSFILTDLPSHYLSGTNSANFYSTEFESYLDIIINIYGMVNEALREVNQSVWINREVVADGVVVNTYSNGVRIVINYTDSAVVVDGTRVEALSYQVVR